MAYPTHPSRRRRTARRFTWMLAALIALPVTLFALRADAPAPAETFWIRGTVTDAGSGQPVAGVNVVVEALVVGAATDAQGRYGFSLTANRNDRVEVTARFIGYAPARQAVRLTADTLTVDFALRPSLMDLEEVVVSGVDHTREAMPAAAPSPMAMKMQGVAYDRPPSPGRGDPLPPDFNTEDYDRIYENPFLSPTVNPLSTFSIDVDAASYSNVRRFINDGRLPPADAVRIEELVNYFTYDYPDPTGDVPFSITMEMAPAPWNAQHRLVHIGLQGRRLPVEDLPPSNLVFLLDVSGSMSSPDKLPLLKAAFRMLVNELRPEDRVAIVVYAGAAGLVLPSTPGTEKEKMLDAIEQLEAGGSTAGGAGIKLAYEVAEKYFREEGNNRVILATDGDFNIGASSDAEMVRLIESKRDRGIFLTVLGFGTGNLKDARMEKIADHGNGNYAYIDSILEAKKVLVSEMGATLLTIAKDVKLQVEFNPARVQGYRLIGYENRLLRAEDFDDDTKDAGELGAGHSVTALYEIAPAGIESAVEIRGVDSLRYQQAAPTPEAARTDEWMAVKLRYKAPDADRSRLLEQVVRERDFVRNPSSNFAFSSAVAAFGMLLRESEHRGEATYDLVLDLARRGRGDDAEGYRIEFIRMVEVAQALR